MSTGLSEIVRFCDVHKMKHTTFGRKCNGDPNLIHDIAKGRQIGHALEARIRSFMAAIEAGEAGQTAPVAEPRFRRVIPAARGRRSDAEIVHEAQHLIVQRDPCWNCAVRRDLHEDQGCRRWVGAA